MFHKLIDLTLGKTIFPVLDFYFGRVFPSILKEIKGMPNSKAIPLFFAYFFSPVYILYVYKFKDKDDEAQEAKDDREYVPEKKRDKNEEINVWYQNREHFISASRVLELNINRSSCKPLCYYRRWRDEDYKIDNLEIAVWRSDWEQLPDILLYLSLEGKLWIRLWYPKNVKGRDKWTRTRDTHLSDFSMIAEYVFDLLDMFHNHEGLNLYKSGEVAKDEF